MIKYNIEDKAGLYAHIIGNGTGYNKRANIYTLDWSGNSWQQGTVEAAAIALPSTGSLKIGSTVLTEADIQKLKNIKSVGNTTFGG